MRADGQLERCNQMNSDLLHHHLNAFVGLFHDFKQWAPATLGVCPCLDW